MEEEPYPFVLTRTSFRYEFTSKSEEKEIKKIVVFTQTDSDIVFNLALMDELEDGKLSDITESNNKKTMITSQNSDKPKLTGEKIIQKKLDEVNPFVRKIDWVKLASKKT